LYVHLLLVIEVASVINSFQQFDNIIIDISYSKYRHLTGYHQCYFALLNVLTLDFVPRDNCQSKTTGISLSLSRITSEYHCLLSMTAHFGCQSK